VLDFGKKWFSECLLADHEEHRCEPWWPGERNALETAGLVIRGNFKGPNRRIVICKHPVFRPWVERINLTASIDPGQVHMRFPRKKDADTDEFTDAQGK